MYPLEIFLRCKASTNPATSSCSLILMKTRRQIFVIIFQKMRNIQIISYGEFGLKARSEKMFRHYHTQHWVPDC